MAVSSGRSSAAFMSATSVLVDDSSSSCSSVSSPGYVSKTLKRSIGFPSPAVFISSDRGKSTFIYKRFDDLAARNLLQLQSELAELQWRHQTFEQQDKSSMEAKRSARSFADFKRAKDVDVIQKERWDLMIQIRHTIKEYGEALLNERSIASLSGPRKKSPRRISPFPTLGGHSAVLYDSIDGLVALHVPENPDRPTMFAQDHLEFLFPDRSRSRKGIVYASERAISTFIAWYSTLLAAILPIGAIVALYNVHSPNQRLGLVATFTCLFAGSVGLLTNARRVELFGATEA
ncbi:hypothetical protein BS50DRAFT_598101 [Corynespora cassiicola Philippines]|uniref:DUF6594 domain-containing protein n=1 Tax=Corynespora cassiicola Philippines TaxID=1448308 RepID=A0A2T2P017_CORCC|nr:hypothetical protein BS50DRAFT_598101 [Corynespora cassiicola Philippines]